MVTGVTGVLAIGGGERAPGGAVPRPPSGERVRPPTLRHDAHAGGAERRHSGTDFMRGHPVTVHVFPDGNNVAGQPRLSTGGRNGVVGTTADRPMFLCMRSGGSATGTGPAPGDAQGDG
ncbi:hypothetical protein GCM10009696_07400 [Kocuria himachalensis]